MDKPDLYYDLAITTLTNFVIPISQILSRSTEVVSFGVTGSSNNIRLNKNSRDITVFNNMIISQLVGHLLGNGLLHYSRTSVTLYFVFTKTIKQFEYIWHIYLTLSSYYGKVPFFNLGLLKEMPHPFIQVMTCSYSALTTLYKLFYKVSITDEIRYTKFINTDLLQYLNSISLAY